MLTQNQYIQLKLLQFRSQIPQGVRLACQGTLDPSKSTQAQERKKFYVDSTMEAEMDDLSARKSSRTKEENNYHNYFQ